MRLYPDQERFVEAIRNAFRSHQSVLAQAPTGFGKTQVSAYIAKSAVEKGKRICFTVHRKNLITQTSRTFWDWGIPHGVIAAGRRQVRHEAAQIGSIQTMVRRLEELPDFDLMVVDECHLACSESWSKVLTHYKARGTRLLGNTATPARLDGRPLRDHFDVIVPGPSVRELIDLGRLSAYEIYAPSEELDLTGVRQQHGDYATADLEVVIEKSKVVGDAVEHYRRYIPGKRALAFCVSIRHSKQVAEMFRAAGIPAAHIDGTTPDEERKRTIQAFADGTVQVLCNVELVTTGFDLSAQVGRDVPVQAAIMLRPTMSLTLWLQMIGRCLRKKPDAAVILDHVNGSARHGFPDDEREWSLEGRKRKKRDDVQVDAIARCEKCLRIYRPQPTCPYCGFQAQINSRLPEHADGELKKIDPEEHRKRRAAKKQEGKAKSLEDWVRLAIERGYKAGWAGVRWALRQGFKADSPEAKKAIHDARELAAGLEDRGQAA